MIEFKKTPIPNNIHDCSEVSIKITEATGLKELISEFEVFIRAVGYSFDGHLDIVENESE